MKTLIFTMLIAAAPTIAQPVHSGDVIIRLNGGRIQTGRVESSVIVYGPRVIAGTFGDVGIPSATFNPGFDSETSAFPPTQPIGITVRKALRRWNGVDGFVLTQAPDLASLNFVKNNITISTPASDPASCGVGPSLTLGLVNASGKLHEHPAYQLVASGADTGIYLVELQLWMNDPAQNVSLPFWLVFNQNDSATNFEAAFAWAGNHLDTSCYPNCDGSTAAPILNALDFSCFLTRFAAADCAANCDGSTAPPVLNALDFGCFLSRFAAGCS